MPQDQPVRQTITHVISQSIQPLARSTGFTKRRFNFHRRQADLIQAVNIQLAPFNLGPKGGFYINLGIAFDRLRELDGLAIDECLRPWECHFYRRIADFCPDAPDLWRIDPGMDLLPVIDSLTNDLKVVLHEFDAITSIPSFLSRNLLHPGADYSWVHFDLLRTRSKLEGTATGRPGEWTRTN